MPLYGKPSPAGFARRLIRETLKLDPSRRYEFDEEGFRLLRTDEHGEITWSMTRPCHCRWSLRLSNTMCDGARGTLLETLVSLVFNGEFIGGMTS